LYFSVQFAYQISRAIWKGYREIKDAAGKDAAGWAALVFAGFGIYRFCMGSGPIRDR
jgi:hypothetical protein